jgi:hypothetical protein
MEMLGEPERHAIGPDSDADKEGDDKAGGESSAKPSGEGVHQFWKVAFQEKDLSADRIGVWYAWSRGEGWEAPNQPRFSLSGAPFLYKTQIRGYLPLPTDDESAQEDPCEKFLRDFVPVLDGVVFSPSQ